jgi:hypothetical protein
MVLMVKPSRKPPVMLDLGHAGVDIQRGPYLPSMGGTKGVINPYLGNSSDGPAHDPDHPHWRH